MSLVVHMCITGSNEAADGGVSIQGDGTIVDGSEQVNECVGYEVKLLPEKRMEQRPK